ncbi:hypothetical protein LINPERPRIM_LOCUS29915 [Linum perenne]
MQMMETKVKHFPLQEVSLE